MKRLVYLTAHAPEPHFSSLSMPSPSRLDARPQVGYCTNVHAGTDLSTIKSRLEEFAVPIARRLPREEQLGVGLWLPYSAACELDVGEHARDFGQWLHQRQLFPFTVNGFPFDNFHLPIVKHRVYLPTWAEASRLDYTVKLARVLAVLQAVGEGEQLHPSTASISTLPIGWPTGDTAQQKSEAGKNFRKLADELQRLEKQTGKRVMVAIEPEPGCILERCEQVVEFFESELAGVNHRRYLGVCHDICHSAVMFEDQADALAKYRSANICVGKVQVSSAIDVPLAKMDAAEREAAVMQLSQFAEDRYLHQTGCIDAQGHFRLVEDLPLWLASDRKAQDQHLRIHFHVPIFLESFGHLRTTRDDILRCVDVMNSADAPEFTGHWEVETYAWSVMPAEMRASGLGNDIASELDWFHQRIELND